MKLYQRIGLLAIALMGAATLSACGERVQPGDTGILVRTFGGAAGVDPTPLPQGWHATGLGEDIVMFRTTTKTYSFDKEEAISFSDHNGVTGLSGDLNITMTVKPSAVPNLYNTYRQTSEELLDGPIRNDIRIAIAEEGEKMSVDQMPGEGRQKIITAALDKVQKKWEPRGVLINQMEWLGNLHYPQVMVDAILSRTKADQEVAAAEAQQKVATAQAATKVAVAQGDADAARIRGQALEANPAVLRQLEIERWDGKLPEVMPAGSAPFILNR